MITVKKERDVYLPSGNIVKGDYYPSINDLGIFFIDKRTKKIYTTAARKSTVERWIEKYEQGLFVFDR